MRTEQAEEAIKLYEDGMWMRDAAEDCENPKGQTDDTTR